MKNKKSKEVTVDTSTESVLYCQGDYPVGHIKRVVAEYDMIYKTFHKLEKNMTNRIKELELRLEKYEKDDSMIDKVNIVITRSVLNELMQQLQDADCWWDASMETKKPGKSWYDDKEICQHLRPFG